VASNFLPLQRSPTDYEWAETNRFAINETFTGGDERLAGAERRLVFPILMRQGMPVKLIPVKPPLRHIHLHEGDKSVAMVTLKKVNHFMDDDVFKAILWFFCQLRVKANCASARIALRFWNS